MWKLKQSMQLVSGKAKPLKTPQPQPPRMNTPVFLTQMRTQPDCQRPPRMHRELRQKILLEQLTTPEHSPKLMPNVPELLNKMLQALLPHGKPRLRLMLLLELRLKKLLRARMLNH
jgi:hypothetical protein